MGTLLTDDRTPTVKEQHITRLRQIQNPRQNKVNDSNNVTTVNKMHAESKLGTTEAEQPEIQEDGHKL